MIQRIATLVTYLVNSFIFSISGLLYILAALAYYLVLFEPRQKTPDSDYLFLVVGILGIVLSFLVTLSLSSRANKAENFPFLVRLPSRIEYLASVMFSALLFAFTIELVIAFLATVINGPNVSLQLVLVMVPVWFVVDLLFVVLALHATDMVAHGWSRVYVFGVLGIILYLNNGNTLIREWLAGVFRDLGNSLLRRGVDGLSAIAYDISGWLTTTGSGVIDRISDLIFWPFSAITDGAINGSFTLSQSMAPAVLLLYSTLLFILAASFYAKKDLFMTE